MSSLISAVSRIFQKEDVDLSLIQPCLKTTIDAIKEYLHCSGPNLSKVDHVLETDLKDFQITATATQKEAFKTNVQSVYIQGVIDHLHSRFPHVALLDAFSIFDPHTLPSDDEDLAGHGQERLEVLVETFGGESIDGDECTSEWECLKRLIHNKYSAADVATPLYGSVIAGHVNKAVHYSCSNSSQYSRMRTFIFCYESNQNGT